MVELTSTSASNGTRSNGTRNWYLYWHRCISSVDVFIIHVMQRHASLCTKIREGVFCLRLERYKFRPQQSKFYIDEKVKIYYKVRTDIHSIV
jgi:hypothetical protein